MLTQNQNIATPEGKSQVMGELRQLDRAITESVVHSVIYYSNISVKN